MVVLRPRTSVLIGVIMFSAFLASLRKVFFRVAQSQAPTNNFSPKLQTSTLRQQLPSRTLSAMSAAFILVAAGGILLGPDLRSVLAEADEHAEHLRMLRLERGSSQPQYRSQQQMPLRAPIAYAPLRSLFSFPPVRTAAHALAYAPAQRPIKLTMFSGDHANNPVAKLGFASSSVRAAINDASSTLSRRSVCVRLCDGYHFPVGDYSGESDNAAQTAACAGMCPGAPTRLYVMGAGADKIDDAISIRDHKPYRSLPVAFRHASTRDQTCSCHGPGESTSASVSLLKDFTLRRGDKVMTSAGFRVFRGNSSLPYRGQDFSTLANFQGISKKERYDLSQIERASGVGAKAAYTPRKGKDSEANATDINTVVRSNGRSVRLIGPQAMLQHDPAFINP